jgi:replicative DNA helicase
MLNKKELKPEQLLQLPDDFAEKLILKQLIKPETTDSSYFIFTNFEEEWFKKNENSELFKVLKAYYAKYQSFPSRNIINKIVSSSRYESIKFELDKTINDIYEINEEDYNKTYLQDMIVRFTKERAIYFTVLNNIETIEKHGDLGTCFQKFEEIAKYDLNSDLGIEYFENINKHVDKLAKPDMKLSTGIKGLDKVLYGGLPVDDTCLFLFMAQPGLGKSMFMANIAANWILMNKKV